MPFQTVHLETLEISRVREGCVSSLTVTGPRGRVLGWEAASCRAQSRAGLAEGAGAEACWGGRRPPTRLSLGWRICPTFFLTVALGWPLLLPGELRERAPPGLWGEVPSLPQAGKDIASPWKLSKLRFGGSCGQPKSSVWTWGGGDQPQPLLIAKIGVSGPMGQRVPPVVGSQRIPRLTAPPEAQCSVRTGQPGSIRCEVCGVLLKTAESTAAKTAKTL